MAATAHKGLLELEATPAQTLEASAPSETAFSGVMSDSSASVKARQRVLSCNLNARGSLRYSTGNALLSILALRRTSLPSVVHRDAISEEVLLVQGSVFSALLTDMMEAVRWPAAPSAGDCVALARVDDAAQS